MTDWTLVVWTYSILNPAAAGLLAWRSKMGFVIGQVAAALMVWHGLSSSELHGLALMGLVYFCINCAGLVKWRDQPWWRRDNEESTQQWRDSGGSASGSHRAGIPVARQNVPGPRAFPGKEPRSGSNRSHPRRR